MEAAPTIATRPLILDLLLQEKRIGEGDIPKILELQIKHNLCLESALVHAQAVSAQEIAELYGHCFKLPLVELTEGQHAEIEKLKGVLPEKIMRDHQLLPLAQQNGGYEIAVVNPLNIPLFQELHLLLQRNIRLRLAKVDEMEATLDRLFGTRDFVKEISSEKVEEEEKAGDPTQDEVLDLEAPLPEGKDTKVLRLVNHVLKDAALAKASDIHLEPFDESARIRYRVDGVLQEISPPPKNLFTPLISRLKILSKMDIAEKRIPQDGAFTMKLGDNYIDLRVSCLPVVWGEKIVMRLLNKSAINMDLTKLGFSERQYKDFIAGAESENGLILVTGPTGSGKSTTLYATLNLLKSPEINISTVEDPVEYRLDGINQVQVKSQVGLTFASGLRSFLRQDPDIILVGEVRDQETANICMKAALTGHLVLSTLHTNDALASVSRLVDMGVEPFVIASTLRLVEAQRLIRRLCVECKESYECDPETAQKYGFPEKQTLYRAKGCANCRNLGYRGRVGIFEVVRITPALRDLIQARAPLPQLQAQADKEGMVGLFACGLQKVKEGVTSLEEVVTAGGGE